jgi:hypothetical protein
VFLARIAGALSHISLKDSRNACFTSLDVAGARAFGFRLLINRSGAFPEELGFRPDATEAAH